MEAHYKACLNAGVKIAGTNAEVMPGQWEYQIGICRGIAAADHLWMARYLMHRVCEYYNVSVDISPKPIKGDWNGSGCHTNYSTNQTRNDDGMATIKKMMNNMEDSHKRLCKLYGEDNHFRLTGKHETSSMDKFSFGVANRSCSVRIPRVTDRRGKGYFEDRRPAANMDPYVVISALFSTTCLDNRGLEDLEKAYENFREHKKSIGKSN